MAVILFLYMMEIRAGNCLNMWQTQIQSQELKSNVHPCSVQFSRSVVSDSLRPHESCPHKAKNTLEKHKLRQVHFCKWESGFRGFT